MGERAWASLVEVVRAHSAREETVALRYLADGERESLTLTYAELDARCRAVATWLRGNVAAGARVLVSGDAPEVAVGVLGAWYAGCVAVPAPPTEGHGAAATERRRAVITSAGCAAAVGDVDDVQDQMPTLAGLPAPDLAEARPQPNAVAPDQLALVQFTSGTTAHPRGIELEQRHVLANQRMIADAFEHDARTVVVGWLPLHHDMGLIGNLLQPLFAGGTAVLMPPSAFLRRPRRWLRAISRYRATTSGGPDFAYDLCVRRVEHDELAGCDLGSWRVAYNGAERIRPRTIERFSAKFSVHGFRHRAFYPCYGLAEATLFVTGGRVDAEPEVVDVGGSAGARVACGTAWHGTEVRIVDPSTRRVVADWAEGEIWVRGPAVARGYTGATSEDAFGATTAAGEPGFLRTGDLGRSTPAGLVITGRLKDGVIVRGRSVASEDIEAAVEHDVDGLAASSAVAYSSAAVGGDRVSLVVEVDRSRTPDPDALVLRARRAAATHVGVEVDDVMLVRVGAIPRTSSGKPRRSACREAIEGGTLAPWHRSEARPLPSTAAVEEVGARPETLGDREALVRRVLAQLLAGRAGTEAMRVDAPLADAGLDSVATIELGVSIEYRFGVVLSPALLQPTSTLAELAAEVAARWGRDDAASRGEAGRDGDASLTAAERAIWVASRVDEPGSYTLAIAGDIEGSFDLQKLAGALQRLVDEHPALRTRFPDHDGEPYRDVAGVAQLDIAKIATAASNRDDDVAALVAEPFDVARGPLFRIRVLEAGASSTLILIAHHLILDLWSAGLLLTELGRVLDAAPSAARPVPRIDCQPTSGSSVVEDLVEIDEDTTREIRALARQLHTTPFVVMTAALRRALGRLPSAPRQLLVTRAERHGGQAFRAIDQRAVVVAPRLAPRLAPDLASEITRAAAALANDAPVDAAPGDADARAVVAWQVTGPGVDAALLPFLLGLPGASAEIGPLRLTARPIRPLALPFGASLMLGDLGPALRGWIRTRGLDTSAVMHELGRALREPATDGRPLGARFEAAVDRFPSKTALTFGDVSLTYRELDDAANALAHRLLAMGVAIEDSVALLVERSLETVVGILAILKCGAAYVPIDPETPLVYQRRLLRSARVVLTRERFARGLDVHLPTLFFEGHGGETSRSVRPVHRANAAYVIHTSGSTGDPKGVVVTHGNVTRLIDQLLPELQASPADVWSCFHSASFDFSVWEIWGALLSGGHLVMLGDDERRDPSRLRAELERHGVTLASLTPTVFREFERVDALAARGWDRKLRAIVFGGESVDLEVVGRWFARHGDARPQLINMYGITETTVHVTVRRLRQADVLGVSRSPLGRPIAGLTTHVLDERLAETAAGVAGELYVGGAGVARGYLGRADLTAERFVPDPFSGIPGSRMYRTGDRASWTEGDELAYLGRLDHQLKIRGIRVELTAIEAALAADPAVAEAAVVQIQDAPAATPHPGDAHRVFRHGHRDASVVGFVRLAPGHDDSAMSVLSRMRDQVPVHMVPTRLVVLEQLPRTIGDKLDRARLRELAALPVRAGSSVQRFAGRTPEEEDVAAVWTDVLDTPPTVATDDFFRLGGDSIRALRVQSRLAARGYRVSAREVFRRTVLADLAAHLVRDTSAEAPARYRPFSLAPEETAPGDEGTEDAYPLSQLQLGLLFHTQAAPGASLYREVFSYDVAGNLSPTAFRAAVARVVQRHPILRTVFELGAVPVQRVLRVGVASVEVTEVSQASELETVGRQLTAALIAAPFAAHELPLVRFHTVYQPGTQYRVILCFHAALLDGWSVASLITELLSEHARLTADPAASELPPPSGQFVSHVAGELRLVSDPLAGQFWRDAMSGAEPLRVAPTSTEPPRVEVFPVEVPDHVSRRLIETARRHALSVKHVLLAVHLQVLIYLTGRTEVITGVETHARPDGIEPDVLGLFLNTVPLRVTPRGTWLSLALAIREIEIEQVPYRGFPLAEIQRLAGTGDLFDVSFNYTHFHQLRELADLPGSRMVGGEGIERSHFALKVELNRDPFDDRLQLDLEIDTARILPRRRAAIIDAYRRALAACAESPESSLLDAKLWSPDAFLQDPTTFEPTWTRIEEAVTTSARRTPQAVAIRDRARTVRYDELDQLSARVAGVLRARGVAREDVIAVLMPRSASTVIAVVGILRAGAAFLLLDPEDPLQRVATLLDRARPKLVITDLEVLLADSAPPAPPLHAPHPDDLAYVVYTSGSSGVPKGVAGTHVAMANRIRWQCETFPARPGDVAACKTSPRFVDAIAEMLAPLCAGMTLEIVAEETARDPHALLAQLTASGVTHLVAVPSLLRAIVDAIAYGAPIAPLRSIVSSGEALTVALARDLARALPEARLYNYYGTSEIAADVTWHAIEPSDRERDGVIPAGVPLPGVRGYILSAALQPVPVGTVGELYVGGIAIARGYRDDPSATADRFVPDPFTSIAGARMYRTGDLASVAEDGKLHIRGRADRQVKIRGNRIELAELEVVLGEHPAVSAAALSTRQSPDGLMLVAHVESSSPEATPDALRDHLAQRLPAYALPSSFEVVSALPRLPSGKLDRTALAARAVLPSAIRIHPTAAYVPSDQTHATVADVWEAVLGHSPSSANANFFREGGDSLSALRLVHALQQRVGARLPLPSFLAAPTVSAVAAWLSTQPMLTAVPAALQPNPTQRHEPFALSDVQQAYWVGRSDELALGGVGSQLYLDVEARVDAQRLEQALQELVARHDMLRTVVREDGRQQTLTDLPKLRIPVAAVSDEELAGVIADNRSEMVNRVFDPATWPLFDVRLTQTPSGASRIQIALDLLVADAWSMRLLVHELMALHDGRQLASPSPLTFRDYIVATRCGEPQLLETARAYWSARIETLPPAPTLPTRTPPPGSRRAFRRVSATLPPEVWSVLRRRAHDAGITPASLLITVFAESLALYSESRRFTLNLTLYDRLPVHPDVDRIVGDFTTLDLLEFDMRGPAALGRRAAAVHRQIGMDLEHRRAGGIPVLRELTRRQPDRLSSMMPVVFTSTLGLGTGEHAGWLPDSLRLVESLTQTPQVTLDHQVREDRGALIIDWDYDEQRFPPGLIDELFATHEALLRRLTTVESAWHEDAGDWLAARLASAREAAQQQTLDVPFARLEDGWLRSVERTPDSVAISGGDRPLTYRELHARAAGLAARLRERGIAPGDRVGIVLPHGEDAIAAVLAVLWVGAAYVPVDVSWPDERRRAVLARTKTAIRGQDVAARPVPTYVPDSQRSDAIAYVMHTSGSTGEPKGVMVAHGAAWNTIAPLLSRWNIGASDAVLAVSALGFDLSVFDIFGTLAVGGRVVIPAGDARRDPARWAALVRAHRVTIWNSVPALMELLLDHVEADATAALRSLRLVMLSGDWVPVDLAARIRRAVGGPVEVVALGGATEAAIWSIAQDASDLPPDATSVPYGRSLPNQRVHVWDDELRERGTWAVGELFITGAGLAHGYLDAPAVTAARFLPHGAQRAYRTGDLGCYRPDGSIELHGRRDGQVKIAGHRIELGEVERALRACAGVADAVAVATGPRGSQRRLRGVVTPKGPSVDVDRIRAELRKTLPEAMVPSDLAIVPRLPLTPTGKVDRGALAAVSFERALPAVARGDSPLVSRIAVAVGEIIGHATIDPDADLLAMGVTSIDAVRIANRLQRDLGFRPGLEQIYRRPTVAALAQLAGDARASLDLPLTRLDADPVAREGMICAAALPKPDGAPVALPATETAPTGERRSVRSFRTEPVTVADLARLLAPLRRMADGRFAYASAGGLYVVRAYVHLRDGTTELPRGLYAYDASAHELAPLASVELGRELHEPFLNRGIFDQAAFSIFFAAKLDDARSIYGTPARDFCLIEAGAMAQLVAQAAGSSRLGLCPIGFMDFAPVRAAIDVGPDLELLHSFVGGVAAEGDQPAPPLQGPLTSAQRRIWFEQRLRPESPAWNIVAAVRIEGSVDAAKLEHALTEMQARHAALRTTFHAMDDGPVQRVAPPEPFELRRQAFALAHRERPSHAERTAAELGAELIDLEHGPVWRATLLDYSDTDHVLVLVVHHIVADGWSMNLLVQQIAEEYSQPLDSERPRREPDTQPSAIEVADAEHVERSTRRSATSALTWTSRLADAPPLRIPGEQSRTGEPTLRGQLLTRTLPGGVTDALEALAVSEQASLFMVLVAAFQLLCADRTGQSDLIVGVGTANRRRADLERTIGCFVNLVAVRTDLSRCDTTRDVLRAVRDRTIQALEDGAVAFDAVVESLQPVRGLGQTPWMRAVLVMQNSAQGLDVPGLRLSPMVVDTGTTRFDFTLFFVRTPDGQLTMRAQFATDVLSPDVVSELLDALEASLVTLPFELDRTLRRPPTSPARSALRSVRAAPVSLPAERVLTVRPMDAQFPDGPAIICARDQRELAATWMTRERTWMTAELRRRGALLLRGLFAPRATELRRLATAHEGVLIDDNGELPREGLDDGIYGAVDYPPGEYILWHNENAFYRKAPARLWFQCQEAAAQGGATPVVDGRRMLRKVPEVITQELMQRRVMYIRRYGEGLGLGWQDVFRTTDRRTVEARCAAQGVSWTWTAEQLETRSIRRAIINHPATGEPCWFNQLTHWHPECLPPESGAALSSTGELTRDVRFGDGGVISAAFIAEVCGAYASLEVATDWQVADILVIDNALMSHARRPYAGTRRLAIAMAGTLDEQELAAG